MKTNHLAISWAVSRGVDTYGYNICRLDSSTSGKRYRTCGGGYDMIGTVIGQYLQAEHCEAIMSLVKRLMSDPDKFEDAGYSVGGFVKFPDLYGMVYNTRTGNVSLDGACGVSSMQAIGEAIGISWQRLGNRKGQTTGYVIGWEA